MYAKISSSSRSAVCEYRTFMRGSERTLLLPHPHSPICPLAALEARAAPQLVLHHRDGRHQDAFSQCRPWTERAHLVPRAAKWPRAPAEFRDFVWSWRQCSTLAPFSIIAHSVRFIEPAPITRRRAIHGEACPAAARLIACPGRSAA